MSLIGWKKNTTTPGLFWLVKVCCTGFTSGWESILLVNFNQINRFNQFMPVKNFETIKPTENLFFFFLEKNTEK